MYAAATGSRLQMLRLEVVANNLANASTVGYKEDKTYFSDVLKMATRNDSSPVDPTSALSEKLSSIINFKQGPVRQTGHDMDVAIEGKGLFVVEKEGEIYYTRNGAFRLDTEGRLATADGGLVQGESGEITVGDGRFEVSSQGGVFVNGEELDQLKIVAFEDTRSLRKESAGLFIADPNARPVEDLDVQIAHRALEMSNVNPIRQMTEMVEAGRVFEAYQKIIKMVDTVNQRSATQIGKI
jgi:flagellar basal-body rod protein FlgG